MRDTTIEEIAQIINQVGRRSRGLRRTGTASLNPAPLRITRGRTSEANSAAFDLRDDSQNGADHIDSHRSTAYIVGPYVKHGVVVSKKYTQVNMLRTIEDLLGLDHIDVLTASESPMTDVFDISQKEWTFDAVPSFYLYNTRLPLPPRFAKGHRIPKPLHDVAYWAEKTKGFDFSHEDALDDPEKFNRIIWEGLHGNVPYPTTRSGLDLRQNRAELLKKYAIANHSAEVASTDEANNSR